MLAQRRGGLGDSSFANAGAVRRFEVGVAAADLRPIRFVSVDSRPAKELGVLKPIGKLSGRLIARLGVGPVDVIISALQR